MNHENVSNAFTTDRVWSSGSSIIFAGIKGGGMLRKVLWFGFLLMISASSCLDEPDCFALNNNFVQISFRRLLDNSADSISFIGIGYENVVDSSAFADEIIITNNSVTLPLNFLQNQTSYNLVDLLGANSFRLVYESRAQFVSEDCGERFVLSNLQMEDHNFDSVRIINAIPSGRITSNNPNIIVYRCPVLNYVSVAFRQLYTDTVALGYPMDRILNAVSADYDVDLFYGNTALNAVTLPVNDASTSTNFNLHFAEGTSTLTLNYDVTPVDLVNVCGTQGLVNNLSAASGDFDIVRVLRDSLQDPPVTNVALLRCPDTDVLRIDFQTAGGNNADVYIKEITADYTPYVFYNDVTLSTVDLSLNPLSDTTIFTLDFQDSVRTIKVGYARAAETLHGECDQTRFSEIGVLSDFAAAPEVVSPSIQFPPETNIEIVTD